MSGVGDRPRVYRGSRKHILDWVESPNFVAELQELVRPVEVVIAAPVTYVPKGYSDPREAELAEAHGAFEVLRSVRHELRDWWLKHHRGARTPTWDLVAACEIDGRSGLVLIEAKANSAELKADGISPAVADSPNSRANHEQIAAAIASAREGLASRGFQTIISDERHYQLANRVAFLWKLASLGIPTVLVYLGFTGDQGMADAGLPFEDEADWRNVFLDHAKQVIPASMLESRLDLGTAPAWLLVRSRNVISQSPRPGGGD